MQGAGGAHGSVESRSRRRAVSLAAPLLAWGGWDRAWAIDPSDGSLWATHRGPFDDKYFDSFKSSPPGISYKFLRQGDGEKPVQGQKVFVHYVG